MVGNLSPQQMMQQIFQQMMQQSQGTLGQPAVPAPPIRTEEDMKRDRLRAALAQAGKTLATTPGNFLTGLGTAVGSAGEAYHKAKTSDRDKMAKDYETDQKKRQDLMRNLLTGAGTLASGQRADAAGARAAEAARRATEQAEWVRARAGRLDLASRADRAADVARRTRLDKAAIAGAKAAAKFKVGEAAHKRTMGEAKALTDRYKVLGLGDPLLDSTTRASKLAEYEAFEKGLRGGRGALAAPATRGMKPKEKARSAPAGTILRGKDGKLYKMGEDGVPLPFSGVVGG